MSLLRFFILFVSINLFGANLLRAGAPDVPVFSYHTMLKFVENKGQWDDRVIYRAEVPGGLLYVKKDGLTFLFYDQEKLGELQGHSHDHGASSNSDFAVIEQENIPIDNKLKTHVLNINFKNCNSNVSLTGEEQYSENISYFIGNDKSKWGHGAHAFNKIIFHEIYQGVDLHLFKHGVSLKYEFIVQPGANPNEIQLEYEGAEMLKIINEQLLVKTSVNQFYEAKPFVYQRTGTGSKNISTSFNLNDNVLSFDLHQHYNKRNALVIDPQLIFSSYSGSVADNWGNTACVDKDKNLYTGGTIFPTDAGTTGNNSFSGFPATPGAFQQSWQGGHTDVGILKFDSAGTNLVYATYIGGNDGEIPTSTITNSDNELYILITTSSDNFPVTSNAYDTVYNGGNAVCGTVDCYWDPFPTNITCDAPCNSSAFIELVGGYSFYNGSDIAVVKLSADGSSLLGSTYIGGSGNDGILYKSQSVCNNYGDQLRGDINVDSNGNVYVMSTTQSIDFPTKNGVQMTFGGGVSDACVFKLGSDLDTLIWSTFLGGNDSDAGFSIQRDSLNNVYVAGGTASDSFPTTNGVLFENKIGGIDGFVTHISADGGTLLQSTLVGTTSFDQAYFVQLDSDENVYLLGQTKGSYSITPGTYNNPGTGQFIHKLSHDLDTTIFSTVFGADTTGVPDISPTAFLVNDCGNIFVSGWGGDVNNGYNDGDTDGLPITSNAYQTTTDGSDFYLAAFRKGADSLIYATYFGGDGAREHVDGGTSRFDKSGIVYQSVCAGCYNPNEGHNFGKIYPDPEGFPISGTNVVSPTNGSRNCNNGVFKFDLANLKAVMAKPPGCLPLEVTFENNSVGGINFEWYFGDGKDTITPTSVPVTHVYDTTGTYTVTLIANDLTTCIGVDSTSLEVTVNGQPPNELFQDTTCYNTALQLTSGTHDTTGVNDYSWSPTIFLNNPSIKNPITTPTSSIEYIVTITDSIGCEQVDTVEVTVDRIIPEATWSVVGNCAGAPLVRFGNNTTGFPPMKYTWDFDDGGTSNETFPEHQYAVFDTFTVVLTATNNECSSSQSYEIITKPTSAPNVITPNGDDINDYFIIENIEGTGEWQFDIYNRWGERVFHDNAYSNNWNGVNNHNGNLKVGTYFYLITSPDGSLCKGWVEIFR